MQRNLKQGSAWRTLTSTRSRRFHSAPSLGQGVNFRQCKPCKKFKQVHPFCLHAKEFKTGVGMAHRIAGSVSVWRQFLERYGLVSTRSRRRNKSCACPVPPPPTRPDHAPSPVQRPRGNRIRCPGERQSFRSRTFRRDTSAYQARKVYMSRCRLFPKIRPVDRRNTFFCRCSSARSFRVGILRYSPPPTCFPRPRGS